MTDLPPNDEAPEELNAPDGTRPLNTDPVFIVRGICHMCIFYGTNGPWTCDAFPGGIPYEILVGKVIHNVPYEGDGGIRYQRDPDAIDPGNTPEWLRDG